MSDVANTIYRQLGGNRFRVMTGAKMMVSTENGIRMRIGRNKTNANFMEVSLNGLDLYDVTFAKLTKMGEMKSVKTYDNVYNDMLVSIFESHTGMYTTLQEIIMSREVMELFDRAHHAGLRAGHESTPTPMVVGSPSTPFGSDIDWNKST